MADGINEVETWHPPMPVLLDGDPALWRDEHTTTADITGGIHEPSWPPAIDPGVIRPETAYVA